MLRQGPDFANLSGIVGVSIKTFLVLILFYSLNSMAEDSHWQFAAGLGPNFTQLDAVGDSLKSDIGVSLWARRYQNDSRFFTQLTFDYFKFGSDPQMQNYLVGVGYLFGESDRFKHDAVLGAGLGHAKKFPRATPDQKGASLQARYSVEYKWKPHLQLGLALEFVAVDLDDKQAKEAFVSLPMVYFAWTPSKQPKEDPNDKRKKDTDQDGVKDHRDRCPGTPLGSVVNKFGCVKKEKVQMQVMVNFATDSDVINESDFKELKELAEILTENSKATVTIEGHTDSMGNFDYNMDLSARRAAAVRKHLIEKFGIEANRITSAGFGPKQPVADNNTIEGRFQNRRVLAVFEPNEENK